MTTTTIAASVRTSTGTQGYVTELAKKRTWEKSYDESQGFPEDGRGFGAVAGVSTGAGARRSGRK